MTGCFDNNDLKVCTGQLIARIKPPGGGASYDLPSGSTVGNEFAHATLQWVTLASPVFYGDNNGTPFWLSTWFVQYVTDFDGQGPFGAPQSLEPAGGVAECDGLTDSLFGQDRCVPHTFTITVDVWDNYRSALLFTLHGSLSYVPDPATNPDCGGSPYQPTLTTQSVPSQVSVGQPFHDVATLAGGQVPQGLMMWWLYGPDDGGCTGTPIALYQVPVGGDGTYTSPDFTPTLPGTYRWQAFYNPSNANASVFEQCNDTGESTLVIAGPPPPGGHGIRDVQTRLHLLAPGKGIRDVQTRLKLKQPGTFADVHTRLKIASEGGNRTRVTWVGM